jgi:hypothetical protein
MQFANCDVCLGGDRNHVVHLTSVSPAEIEVLRVIHGEDAVTNIKLAKTLKQMSQEDILDMLRRKYRGNVSTTDGPPKNIVDQVYSGPRVKLPTYLKEVGVKEVKPSDKPSDVETAPEETDDPLKED